MNIKLVYSPSQTEMMMMIKMMMTMTTMMTLTMMMTMTKEASLSHDKATWGLGNEYKARRLLTISNRGNGDDDDDSDEEEHDQNLTRNITL